MCGPLRGSGFEIAGIMVSVSSVWRYLATGIFEGVLKRLCKWSIQADLRKKVDKKLEEMKRDSAKRGKNRQGKNSNRRGE